MGKNNNKDGINNSYQRPLLDLFPEIEPYSHGMMDVDVPHKIYWEECGNPDGVPLICLHGGPGAACSPILRQFFDPDYYRIILFDQRGCGRSTPHGCLEDNNTAALLRDIEQLRQQLKIEQWHVFGGSWGSTLALSYAVEHADKISSMVLRGIFLMEARDIEWFMDTNKNIFPEPWEQFVSVIPEDERVNLLNAYYKRLTSPDKDIQLEAAISWSLYESACARLIPNYETVTTPEQKKHAIAISLLECHYFKYDYIKPKDSLVNKVDAFRHIPTTIVQGRYDMVCPILSAHRLHSAWPEAEYIVVPDGGHSALDPTIRSQLIAATEKIKTIKKKKD